MPADRARDRNWKWGDVVEVCGTQNYIGHGQRAPPKVFSSSSFFFFFFLVSLLLSSISIMVLLMNKTTSYRSRIRRFCLVVFWNYFTQAPGGRYSSFGGSWCHFEVPISLQSAAQLRGNANVGGCTYYRWATLIQKSWKVKSLWMYTSVQGCNRRMQHLYACVAVCMLHHLARTSSRVSLGTNAYVWDHITYAVESTDRMCF